MGSKKKILDIFWEIFWKIIIVEYFFEFGSDGRRGIWDAYITSQLEYKWVVIALGNLQVFFHNLIYLIYKKKKNNDPLGGVDVVQTNSY